MSRLQLLKLVLFFMIGLFMYFLYRPNLEHFWLCQPHMSEIQGDVTARVPQSRLFCDWNWKKNPFLLENCFHRQRKFLTQWVTELLILDDNHTCQCTLKNSLFCAVYGVASSLARNSSGAMEVVILRSMQQVTVQWSCTRAVSNRTLHLIL